MHGHGPEQVVERWEGVPIDNSITGIEWIRERDISNEIRSRRDSADVHADRLEAFDIHLLGKNKTTRGHSRARRKERRVHALVIDVMNNDGIGFRGVNVDCCAGSQAKG